jgi:polysaccharide biosynthesis protein PslG
MLSLLASCLLAGASYRSHFPLPGQRVPDGWGVNIHFTQEQPGELARIAKVFKWVRMDFVWSDIEKTRGQYDFSAYDTLMKGLDANGLRGYFIFDYGNDLYQDGSPATDDARAAFCRFVEASLKHFRHQGIVWEMWNEPNIGFWKPKPDVSQYAKLALDVGKTIRRVAPDEWYIGPASSTFDWNFIKGCFDAGLLTYWDAVSIHPYRPGPPESVLDDWKKLATLIGTYHKHLPMISGEWGYSDIWSGQSPQVQGDFMVRQYLTNLSAGVGLSIYYDWKDDGTSPTDSESHFGTNTNHGASKPAYDEAAALVAKLQGYSFGKRLPTDSPDDFVLRFSNRHRPVVVTWTAGAPHKLQNSSMTVYFTNRPVAWP